MVRTQIQLTEEQARALKALATRRGVSLAELVREGVDEVLSRADDVAIADRRRRALEAVGRFHSGLSDLSTEHDKYLAEAFEQ